MWQWAEIIIPLMRVWLHETKAKGCSVVLKGLFWYAGRGGGSKQDFLQIW